MWYLRASSKKEILVITKLGRMQTYDKKELTTGCSGLAALAAFAEITLVFTLVLFLWVSQRPPTH